MIKNKIKAKLLTGLMSAALIVGLCPASAFAVTGDQVAADGKYTSDIVDAESNDTGWNTYGVKAEVTVENGAITAINVTTDRRYDSDKNGLYFDMANGMINKLKGLSATADAVNACDTVSHATITSKAIKTAVVNALDGAEENEGEVEYVMMNIPYSDFYEAELSGNTEPVDGVSSATLNKTRTESLVGGSYHVDSEGKDITGVTFPVKLGDGVYEKLKDKGYVRVKDSDSVTIEVTNRGQTSTTTYKGQDALFENESYAYYVLKGEAPSYYKELTIDENGNLQFGEIQTTTERKTISGTAKFTTNSTYGDYELMVLDSEGEPLSSETFNNGTIYGVVVSAEDSDGVTDYGLRHLENIWRVYDLAWCTGFTTKVHNCPTASEHYKSMMGKTIKEVTYYTSTGIYEISLNDIYVPIKFENSVNVEDALVTAGKTSVTIEGLEKAEGYTPEYAVNNLEGAEVNVINGTGTITWDEDKALNDVYTLTIKDTTGKYANLSASFTLSTELMPAKYNEKDATLVKANGDITDDQFKYYLENIASVKVGDKDGNNETVYSASGRGSVQIIDPETGAIKADATDRDAAIFKAGQTYEITVTAQTYAKDLTFEYTAPTDTTALAAAIADAENLNKSDYTAESWEMLEGVIAAAKVTLESDPTQVAADEAVEAINNAIAALEKPATDPSDEDTPNNDGTVGGDNNNGGNTNGEATSTDNGAAAATDSAAQTGDDTALMGLIALAVASLGGAGFAVTRRRKAGENK